MKSNYTASREGKLVKLKRLLGNKLMKAVVMPKRQAIQSLIEQKPFLTRLTQACYEKLANEYR